MGRRKLARIGAVLATLSLLTAACGDDDDEGTVELPEATPPLEVTGVDYAFEGLPEELPGGAVAIDFENTGAADHEIAFVEIGDVPLDQFLTEFAPVIDGSGPFPDYVTNIIGANEAAPGESTSLVYTLSEGTYAVFCALTSTADDPDAEGAPHFELGMKDTVTVTSPEGDVELPGGDGTITAEDFTFEVDLTGGDEVINFTNTGPAQTHFAGFDLYPEGTTVGQAEEAFATFLSLDEGAEPPEGTIESEEVSFSGVATPGNSIQFSVPGGFQAGRTYLFYCFISDREGGPPHALPEAAGGHGMYKAFTIE